jgi:hypothetical protein
MKCSSTANECDKILLMAHSVAFGTFGTGATMAMANNRPKLSLDELRLLASILQAATPGTSVAGACIESLEKRLNGPMARLLPAFRQGLAAVEAACVAKTGSSMIELQAVERSKFVRELRSGHKLTAFFRLLTGSCALSHLTS